MIFAHRGASKEAPENTMPAFELAYQYRADGIETDVQLTKDNIPVLIHDETVNRTTDSIGFVKDYSYKDLQALDAGKWKSPSYTNTKIPTLDDLLAWNQDKHLKLNIELKNDKIAYKKLEEIVIDKLKKYNMEKETILSSFSEKSIKRLHDIHSPVPYALLTGKAKADLLPFSKEMQANGIHIRYRLLSKRIIQQANREGLYVAVYTVNHPAMIKRAIRLGCQIVITDVPDIARKVKTNYGKGH